ncbi:MAG TPA: Calx-beta domain-containing protein [Acidimicrobiales bacterium]|nr:Calx-beta domain-containing protein [Acidimicrobiales bacterium]
MFVGLGAIAAVGWFGHTPPANAALSCTSNAVANGFWDLASTWDAGGVPNSPTAVACIPSVFTVTMDGVTGSKLVKGVAGTGTLAISGGALTLNDAVETSTMGVLNISSGILTGASNLTVGAMTWSGGTLKATQDLKTLTVTGATTLSGGLKTVDNRRIALDGNAVWSGGNIVWTRSDTSFANQVITVASGKVLDITSPVDVSATSSDVVRPGLVVTGTLRKSGAAALATVATDITNDGSVESLAGTLTLGKNGSGRILGMGGWTAGAGATTEVRGGTNLIITLGNITGPGTLLLASQAPIKLPGAFASAPTISAQTVGDGGGVWIESSGSGNPGALAVGSGGLWLERSLTVSSLTQTGGALLGASPLTVTGPYNWTGGTSDRGYFGPITVAGETSFAGSGLKSLSSGTLNLNGGATWSGGSISAGGTSVMNNPGLFAITTPGGESFSGFQPKFNNTSTGIVRRTGAGRVVFGPSLDNQGRVEVASGTLALGYCAQSSLASSVWAVASAATLEAASPSCGTTFNGTLDGPGTFDANALGGGFVLELALTNAPVLSAHSGTLFVGGSGNPSALVASGGDLTINRPLTVNSASVSSGTLSNDATTTVGAGGFAWSGGALSGSGTTTVNGALAMTGDAKSLAGGHTLNVAGGATWTAGNLTVDNATIRNTAGTFAIPATVTLDRVAGTAATFRNLPGAVLDVDGSPVTLESTLDNDGAVSVDGASLTVGSAESGDTVETSTGSFAIATGKTMTLAGSTHTLAGAITGAGSLAVSGGSQTISGALGSARPLSVSGGALTLSPTSGTAGAVTVSDGTLSLPNATSFSSLTQSGGNLDGAGALTLQSLNWSGGDQSGGGTGTTTVSGVTSLNSGSKSLTARGLTLNGAATWSGGDIQIVNATLLASTIDAAMTSGTPLIFGNGTLRVTGALTRNQASGAPYIASSLDNDGVVNMIQGSLRVGNVSPSSTGSFQIGAGARLETAGPGVAIATSITGPGTVKAAIGDLTVTGGLPVLPAAFPTFQTESGTTLHYAPSGGAANFVVPAGTIDVSGDAAANVVTINGGTLRGDNALTVGTLNWSSGGMAGAGSTIANAATISTTAVKTLTERSLVLNGATDWQAGKITAAEAAIDNNGALTVSGNSNLVFDRATGSFATFNNGSGGTVTRTGTGVATFEGAFNNNGVVNVTNGNVTVGDNSSSSSSPGDWNIAAGRTLTFAGPSDTLAGVITGPGAVKFSAGNCNVVAILLDDPAFIVSGGTVTLAPASAVIDELTVTAGIVLIPENLAANTVALNGGTINGAGDLSVAGAFSWQRGIMSGAGTTTIDGPLTLNTTGKKTLGSRTLATNGATTWSDGVLAFVNASIANAGDFHISAPVTSTKNGTASFMNGATGTLRRSGAGVATLASSVTNNGIIDVAAGTLTLSGGLSNLSGTTLTGGTYVLNGILKAGSGGIATNAATVKLGAGRIEPLAATTDSIAGVTSNSGTLEVLSGSRALTAAAVNNAGSVIVDPSTTLSLGGGTGTLASTATGVVGGAGSIVGTVSGGALRPGASPGILTASNLNATPLGSKLQIELGGTTPGTQHDKVVVSGQATLNRTLEVSFVDGFVPASADTFTILTANSVSGTFSNVVVPAGSTLTVNYTPTSVVLSTPPHHLGLAPANTAVLTGFGQPYTAEGFDAANNSRGDVTGASTFTIDGSPCSGNVCSSGTPGVHTVTATSSGATGSTTLTVMAGHPYDVADYTFDNTLASTVTAPALTDIGPDAGQPAPAFLSQNVFTVTRPVRTFGAGGGLALSPTTSVMPSGSYTALVEFKLTTVTGFRKLIDFSNGAADAGLYVHDGKLQFKGLTGDLGTPMAANTYHDVAISRDGSGNIELYLDGTALGTFADPSRLAVIDSAGVLRLFRDDAITAFEHSAGAVARARLFDHRLAPGAIPGLKTAALSTANVTATEGNGGATQPVNVTITLTPASSAPVTVHWATVDGTAKVAAADYVAAAGDVTFAPGELTKTVSVDVSRDALYEASETLTVALSNPVGAVFKSVALAKSTVTLTNDDAKPTISINDVSITEGNAGTKNLTFTVTLSAPSGVATFVDYATQDGTALAGSDYTASGATLTIPAGTTTKAFNVAIIGDTGVENSETFTVNLTNPVEATIADPRCIATITNDD